MKLQKLPEARVTEGISINDYATWQASRFTGVDNGFVCDREDTDGGHRLGEPGAKMVVELVDKAGEMVPDIGVRLIADLARGFLLHPAGFRQQAMTSALDSAHFIGMPPECIIAYHRADEDFLARLRDRTYPTGKRGG